jgi:hypothetical protein
MTARLAALALMASLLAPPAAGQALRRDRPTAFPPSLTLMAGLGFGGQRATRTGDSLTCPTRDCFEYKVGSSPQGGVEFQIPLGGTLGLGVAGTISRPSRVLCTRGADCGSTDRTTRVHGAALLLWRFKARAPIYFGLGPGATYSKPGPVSGQAGAVTEFGGVAVVAYDVQVASRVGLRIAWWNWLVKPDREGLDPDFTLSGLAWDKLFAVGARISLSP